MIGNTENQDTKVSLQLMTRNKMALEDTMESINKLADECGVEILTGEEESKGSEEQFYKKGF